FGFANRALWDATLTTAVYGGCCIAYSGLTYTQFTTDPGGKKAGLFAYANGLIEEYGTNNSGGSVATAEAGSKAIWAMARGGGATRIVRTALVPKTTGTFATEAGQSYAANCGPGGFIDQFN